MTVRPDISDWEAAAEAEKMEKAAATAQRASQRGSPSHVHALPRNPPTEFVWRDPSTIPPRPWVYGHHLIRKQVSVTVAPGGVGKSSLTISEGLAMATGQRLLGEWTANDLRVWIFNLEDPSDELTRRIVAAMQFYEVDPDEIRGRLFVDTGRERPLCTATSTRAGTQIVRPEMDALEADIRALGIDVLIVDPFVSSHQVEENDNGAIDLVAKEWARLADRCNCAVELVHHTRKTNGAEATTESGRGATSLLAAARSGRVLNKMAVEVRAEFGLMSDPATYFSIDRDKANLAPAGERQWRRMTSVTLANGDSVGVCEVWKPKDAFDGMTLDDLLAVQKVIQQRCDDGDHPRYSDQADNWVGFIVVDVVGDRLGLDPATDKRRIKKIVDVWVKAKALHKVERPDAKSNARPCVEVGEWANESAF